MDVQSSVQPDAQAAVQFRSDRAGGRGLPLYFRLRNLLEESIRAGAFPPGARLPSEHEVCQEYGVSRATVREALRELVDSGLVVRQHGKGSFVSSMTKDAVEPVKLVGSLEDLYDQVERVVARSVEIDRCQGPVRVLEQLALPPETPLIVVRRVREVNGRVLAWTVNFLPVNIGRRLRKADLLKYPLLRLLEERHGIEIAEAVQTLRAVLANSEVALHLEVPFASPLLFAERLYLAPGGTPIQLVQSHYRADRYAFAVRLQRLKAQHWSWGRGH
jgi:GntR family transcriptional regulator